MARQRRMRKGAGHMHNEGVFPLGTCSPILFNPGFQARAKDAASAFCRSAYEARQFVCSKRSYVYFNMPELAPYVLGRSLGGRRGRREVPRGHAAGGKRVPCTLVSLAGSPRRFMAVVLANAQQCALVRRPALVHICL